MFFSIRGPSCIVPIVLITHFWDQRLLLDEIAIKGSLWDMEGSSKGIYIPSVTHGLRNLQSEIAESYGAKWWCRAGVYRNGALFIRNRWAAATKSWNIIGFLELGLSITINSPNSRNLFFRGLFNSVYINSDIGKKKKSRPLLTCLKYYERIPEQRTQCDPCSRFSWREDTNRPKEYYSLTLSWRGRWKL